MILGIEIEKIFLLSKVPAPEFTKRSFSCRQRLCRIRGNPCNKVYPLSTLRETLMAFPEEAISVVGNSRAKLVDFESLLTTEELKKVITETGLSVGRFSKRIGFREVRIYETLRESSTRKPSLSLLECTARVFPEELFEVLAIDKASGIEATLKHFDTRRLDNDSLIIRDFIGMSGSKNLKQSI